MVKVAESEADIKPDDRRSPTPAPLADAPGEAFSFDGRTRITFGGSGTDMANADYTIFARIKTRLGGPIFSKTAAGQWVSGGKALFIGGGKLVFDIGWSGSVSGTRPVADDRWHDVALVFTRESQQVRLFVDGTVDGEGRLEPKAPPSPVIRIGFGADDFPQPPTPTYFDGLIAELRFYGRARRQANRRASRPR